MQSLAYILGRIEVIGVPLSLLGLLMAIVKQRHIRIASALVIVMALTVAQPFGIIATRQPAGPPVNATAVNPTAIHVASAGPIPALPFVLYSEPRSADENAPSAAVKARSWFWLPILTNATRIVDDCPARDSGACWDPPPHLVYRSLNKLSLRESGGTYYVTLGGEGTWKLEPGIASLPGLAYWLVAGTLVVILRAQISERANSLTPPNI